MRKSLSDKTREDLEIDLLLEAIHQQYGYDFRQYSRASLSRRLRTFLKKSELNRISDLIPLALYDHHFVENLVQNISVTVTEMFRDPFVYRMIREKIVPYLKTYPSVNIWVAGCATGEEVYSLAILFKEEGMQDKVRIFATDINAKSIATAKEGIYASETTKISTANYHDAGGTHSFSDYYFTKYNKTMMEKEIRKNINFFLHNLSVDSVFNRMHLVLCRNVLIYFNKDLQNKVLNMLSDSLLNNGFLVLGTKETINFSTINNHFLVIGENEKIYKKHITRNS